jgi:hypothetical protein
MDGGWIKKQLFLTFYFTQIVNKTLVTKEPSGEIGNPRYSVPSTETMTTTPRPQGGSWIFFWLRNISEPEEAGS